MPDIPLSPASLVGRREGCLDAEIDNEVVALNVQSGVCYGLNRVGSRVWALLAAPVRVRDVCAALVAEYVVEPGVCEREVLDLLEQLRAEGLITALDPK